MARRGSLILGRGLLVSCLLAAPGAAGQQAGGAQRLAFVSDREGAQDLYVLDVTRLTTTRLTRGHSQIDTPAWSPDGSRLAFASAAGAASSIFVVGGDGTGLRRLAAGRTPSWSPDGARIAFAATRSDNEDIVLPSLHTSKRRRVTTHPSRDSSPQWTPDGRRLLYRAGGCKFDCRVCVIDLTDGRVHPLSSERPATAFSLSPDGRSVAYSSTRGIFVTDLEGGAARALVPDGWGPAWSRDGGRIAFLVSAGPDVHARHYHIEAIDPAGGNRQRLTAQPGYYRSLTWPP